MKRMQEMTEEELLALRETMTKEEMKAFMEQEEKQLERLVKTAPIQEASFGEEEEDAVVKFNPETGEAVEVESTLLVRQEEEKEVVGVESPKERKIVSKGMLTLTEPMSSIGIVDRIVLMKAAYRIIRRLSQKIEELYDMKFKSEGFKEVEESLTEAIKALERKKTSIRNIASRIDYGSEWWKCDIEEKIALLEKNVQEELMYEVKCITNELLDIL